MAAETNVITTQNLLDGVSIEFTSKFEEELNKFAQALGVANKIPMSVGNLVKLYKYTVSKPSGDPGNGIVAEGDIIPLTHIKKELAKSYELAFKKYRKSTTMEAIQKYGAASAVGRTDTELVKALKKDIRKEFFTFLNSAAGTPIATVSGLQEAAAKGAAAVQNVLDDDITAVVLANPNDLADYLAEGTVVSSGSSFGVTLLSDFLGSRILANRDVPAGKVYVTASENLNLAYAAPSGEIGKAFPFVSDSSGFIGIMHDIQHDRLSAETVVTSAVTIFPEIQDAVVALTLS